MKSEQAEITEEEQNFNMKFEDFCTQRNKQYITVHGYSFYVQQDSQPDTIDIFQVNDDTCMIDIKLQWLKKHKENQLFQSQNQEQYSMIFGLEFYLKDQMTIANIKHKIHLAHCSQDVKIYIFHQKYNLTIAQSAIEYEEYQYRNIQQIETTFKVQCQLNQLHYFTLKTPRKIKISQLKKKLIEKLSEYQQPSDIKYECKFGFYMKIKSDSLTQKRIDAINEDLQYLKITDKIKVQNGFIDFTLFDDLYLRQICPPGQIIYFQPLQISYIKLNQQKQYKFNPKIHINCVRKMNNYFQNIQIVLDYQKIKNIQVSAVLTDFRVYDSMLTSLSIDNLIIKPFEKFSLLEQIIIKSNEKIIELNAIPQNFLFYKELLSFNDSIHAILIQNLKNLHLRSSIQTKNKFQDKFQKRRKDLIKSQKTIQDKNVVQTILLYTGPFFYSQLNKFMRNNSLALIQKKDFDIKSWQYPFCQKMLKSLERLPNYQGLVYRGSKGHKYSIKQGQVIEWNGFTSTTNKIQIALKFLSSSFVYPYVFEIQTFSGKYIADYSFYKNQSEVLIPPYNKFKVIQVSQLCLKKQREIINFIRLKQLPLPKKIPGRLIIWIDNNLNPNTRSFYRILKDNNLQDIELIQLDSNQHLMMWLQQYWTFLNGSQIKVGFISNLNRPPFYQNEGIETFKIIKFMVSTFKIVYYIQKIQQKIKILEKAGINIDNKSIFIASKHQQLQQIIVHKLWQEHI